MTLKEEIKEWYDQGITSPTEIFKRMEGKVSAQYVRDVVANIKNAENENTKDSNDSFKKKLDSFEETLKDIDETTVLLWEKIEELEETMEELQKKKMCDYKCANCGYTWRAPEDKFQRRCPHCGITFI